MLPLTGCFILTHAATYHVPEDYETIHQALASLSSDDTVVVREYYYRERIPRFGGMPTVICEGWEPEFYEIGARTQGSPGNRWVPGDANGDGEVSVGDVVHLANYLYGPVHLPPPACPWDPDGDGDWDADDLTYLVDYFYFDGSPPASPHGWQGQMQVNEPDDDSDFAPDISMNADDIPWAIWYSQNPFGNTCTDILVSSWNGQSWSPEVNIHPPDTFYHGRSNIAFDGQGSGICVWQEGPVYHAGNPYFFNICYAYWNGIGWEPGVL